MYLLEICNSTKEKIDEKWCNSVFKKIMREVELINCKKKNLKNSASVSLCFVNDFEIRKINNKYRGINKTTDVLSFEYLNDNSFIVPSGSSILGEIFISYDQAKRQSKLYDRSIHKELAVLLLHGILHLMGYDHETEKDEKVMKSIENSILKKINV